MTKITQEMLYKMGDKHKVTDKHFYMNHNLVANLDFCVKRIKDNWDNLMIIDGQEGTGKSTFSWGIGYYIAWKINEENKISINKKIKDETNEDKKEKLKQELKKQKVQFSTDNIFFDVTKMMEKAAHSEKQVLIWDEAALEGLSFDHRSYVQRLLIKMLMVYRKKQHFWVFNIPKFYKLNEYIAIDRAFFMIHIYSPDNIRRGNFSFHNYSKKEKIWEIYRATKKKRYDIYDFTGSFTKQYMELLDKDAYEAKKDKAIIDLYKDKNDNTNHIQKKLDLTMGKIIKWMKLEGYTQKDIAKGLGCHVRTIENYSRKAKGLDV